MTLPLFPPSEDPGPSFSALLRKLDGSPPPLPGAKDREAAGFGPITHGTTIVALRYTEGVILAGDRRATAGSSIAHRAMDKVHPADRWSGVAIAGAAGFALEMVKAFQLELEHYEKLTGNVLSLEGKANMLGGMVRQNLPMAMQGMVVVPLFAGFDTRRRIGRIFTYDATGGRYEETDFHADGSGGRDAAHDREAGLDRGDGPGPRHRARRAGPLRSGRRGQRDRRSRRRPRHLPDGRHDHRRGVRGSDRGRGGRTVLRPHPAQERPRAFTMSMPFYVSPEQMIADKAKFARTNIAKGRALVALQYDGGILLTAENPSSTLRKISEIYDRIAFAGVGKYNEYDQLRQAGVRYADVEGFRFSREDVHAKSLANSYAQLLGQSFTHDMKPMEVEILVAEVGFVPENDELFHVLYDGVILDENNFTVIPGDNEAISERLKSAWSAGLSLADALRAASSALSGPERTLAPTDMEAAVLERNTKRRAFRRLDEAELASLLA